MSQSRENAYRGVRSLEIRDQFYHKQLVTNAAVVVDPFDGTQVCRKVIDRIILCEKSGAATTYTIRQIPTGGVDDATSDVFHAAAGTAEVPANDSVVIEGPFYVNSTDTVNISAAANSRIVSHWHYRSENEEA